MTDSLDVPVADHRYDSGSTLCGELALALRAQLAGMPPGAVLEVVARDPAAPNDVPAWCAVTGHALLHTAHPHYWIRRRND